MATLLSMSPKAKSRLRQLRDATGLRGVDICEAVGLSPATLSNIEAGRKNAGREVLASLAVAYGIPMGTLHGYLVGETDLPTVLALRKVMAGTVGDDPDAELRRFEETTLLVRRLLDMTPAERRELRRVLGEPKK